MKELDFIIYRKSIRKFKDKKLSDEMILKLLEAAVSAPNAGNIQYWRFVIIKDKKIKEKLYPLCSHQKSVLNAPLVVVVCANTDEIFREFGQRGLTRYLFQTTATASENMLIAANVLGLGGTWVGTFDDKKIHKLLKLSQNIYITNLLAIGYPDEDPIKPSRKAMKEVVIER